MRCTHTCDSNDDCACLAQHEEWEALQERLGVGAAAQALIARFEHAQRDYEREAYQRSCDEYAWRSGAMEAYLEGRG